jgi:hypothetical protein
MLIEFQAVEEEALKAVRTWVRFTGTDLGDLRCGFSCSKKRPANRSGSKRQHWKIGSSP